MGLPERERRLLLLRHFDGHSVAAIAQIVGRPVGTVTKQLSRGYASSCGTVCPIEFDRVKSRDRKT